MAPSPPFPIIVFPLFFLSVFPPSFDAFLWTSSGSCCGRPAPCCCCQPRPCCPPPPPPPPCCCCPPPPPPAPCHCVARRCCGSPQPPAALLELPQQQRVLGASDLADLGGVLDHQRGVQPIIYVVGGAPLVSTANNNETGGAAAGGGAEMEEAEAAGGTQNATETTAETPEGTTPTAAPKRGVKGKGGKTTTEAPEGNNTTETPPEPTEVAPASIPGLKLRITGAKRPKKEEEEEEEERALDEYEEGEAEELHSNKLLAPKRRRVVAARAGGKLVPIRSGGSWEQLMARRDRVLRGMLKRRALRNSRRISRTRRVTSSSSGKGCNSRPMGRIMARSIDGAEDDLSIAKRLVKRALEFAFPRAKFDVICSVGTRRRRSSISKDMPSTSPASDSSFSYSIYGRRYCEVTSRKGDIRCIAFE